MSVVLRFFVICFALLLAGLAAGAMLVLGALLPVASTLPPHDDAGRIVWFLVFTTSGLVIFLAFAPAVIVILLAETFAWRSILLYALAGGAIGLFYGYSLGIIESAAAIKVHTPLGTNLELIAAAGIAAGLVYWLVAGRNAGRWRESA